MTASRSWLDRPQLALALLTALGVVVAVTQLSRGPDEPPRPDRWWTADVGWCGSPPVTPAHIEEGIDLSIAHLLRAQRPEDGLFVPGYDWHTRHELGDDDQLYQAAATWSIALAYRYQTVRRLRSAVRAALEGWRKYTHTDAKDRKAPILPFDRWGRMGAAAMVTLAHLETLTPNDPNLHEQRIFIQSARSHARFIAGSQQFTRAWRDRYVPGPRATGPGAPTSDGLALLAFARAYVGMQDAVWHKGVHAGAAKGYHDHVEPGDPDVMAAYLPWAMPAWHTLAFDPEGTDAALWAERLIEAAIWWLDEGEVLRKPGNQAAALAAIVAARDIAHRRGHPLEKRLDCAVQAGLSEIARLQVGHALARGQAARAPDEDRARGGAQLTEDDTMLRLDVQAHQLRAWLLARHLAEQTAP